MTTRPISNRLHLFSVPLMSGEDFVMCRCGDSKMADSASTTPFSLGMMQTWQPPQWSGIGSRGVYGQNPAVYRGNDNNGSTSVYAERRPGAATNLTSGTVAPTSVREWKFSANIAASNYINFCDVVCGTRTLSCNNHSTSTSNVVITTTSAHALKDGDTVSIKSDCSDAALQSKNFQVLRVDDTNFLVRTATNTGGSADTSFTAAVGGNVGSLEWYSGVHMAARLIYYREPTNMLGKFAIVPRRNGSDLSAGANRDANGTLGISYFDELIGNGSGMPGAKFQTTDSGGAYDEANKYFINCGWGFYRHDGSGNRLPGLYTFDIAYSSWTTQALEGALGSATGKLTTALDGVPTIDVVAQDRVVEFLQAHFSPKYWLIDIGQNSVASGETESTELAAGTYTTYKLHVRRIIEQIRTLHTAMGLTGLPVILLCNPYNTGNSTTEFEARGNALYELSCEYEGVCFLDVYALMPKSPVSANGQWTKDDTHPTAQGTHLWAGTIWAALKQNYDSTIKRVPL